MDLIDLQIDLSKVLKKAGEPNPLATAKFIISELSQQYVEENYSTIIQRIETQEPVEYIVGKAHFHGLDFKVSPATLIPRMETEMMIQHTKVEALDFLNNEVNRIQIIDVGTGSGAIIISLVKELYEYHNQISFFATDNNLETLKIAKENAKLHNLAEIINFQKTDLITDLELEDYPTLLSANLPYIPMKHYNHLPKSVRDYEPKDALVSTEDGLEHSRRLLNQIKEKRVKYFWGILELDITNISRFEKIIRSQGIKCETLTDQFKRNRFLRFHSY